MPCVRAQSAAPPPAKVTAQLETPTLAPGATATLRVFFDLPSPLHANANPASENYLIPVTVKLASTRALTFGAPLYPKGENKKFVFSEKPLSVYEGKTEITVPITVSRDAKSGTLAISGTLRYQACNAQSCFAPNAVTFKTTIQVGGAPVSSSTTQNTATPPIGANAAPATLTNSDAGDAAKLQREYSVVGIPAIVFIDKNGKERTDLRAGEELTQQTFIAKMAALQSGEKWKGESGGAASWSDQLKSAPLWLQLVLAFLGGLLLNLTPCVYPIIPITVGYFGGQSEGRLSKTLMLGGFYVLGLALVYSMLGVLAAMTGSLFGSLLQSPWVSIGVAIIFFALALSMWGVFTINPPQFLMKGGSQKGILGAFGMGALLGVVAAPCVGPAVGALLIYVGQRGDVLLGFGLFFALSLGLGLPYLVLAAFSGAMKSLPRSGKWMITAKKVFAVLIFLVALFYLRQGFGAFSASRAAASTREAETWTPATLAVLQKARAANTPVIIDFRADWCLPCLKMEREIFHQPEVLNAAKNVQLARADLTAS